MEWNKADGPECNVTVGDEADEHATTAGGDDYDSMLATAATVAVVGAGVLIFEAALLPGLVLGIATMMVPQHLPKIGALVNPLVKSTLRVAYKAGQKTKEIFAEVQEQMHDIAAEVDAEAEKKAAEAATIVRVIRSA